MILQKSVSWTTGSEAVRLQYFDKLALEVRTGKNKSAIGHFLAPRESIEKLYKRAKLSSKSKAEKQFETTFTNLLEPALRDIESSKNKAAIMDVVRKYFENDDDQYFSTFEKKYEGFELFRGSIGHGLRELNLSKQEKPVIGSIESDPEIVDRLGCTESCPCCGALCWGYRGHQSQNDTSELSKHHSCHQVAGLKGTVYYETYELMAKACHEIEDESLFSVGTVPLLWKEATRLHLKDWLFSVHRIKKNYELMRWFFSKTAQRCGRRDEFRTSI